MLHGIAAIRVNGMESYQSGRFRAIVEGLRQRETKMSAMKALIPALIDIVTGLGFVGVLALGGAQVGQGPARGRGGRRRGRLLRQHGCGQHHPHAKNKRAQHQTPAPGATTVTARRFCAQADSSEPRAAGRSLP